MQEERKETLKEFLEKLFHRKIYTSLDEETVRRINDEDLLWAIMDYVSYKIGEEYEKKYEIVMGLAKGFQVIYTTWWAESELNNGGFSQYFWNPSREFALESIDGFFEIGAPKTADLVARAVRTVMDEDSEFMRLRGRNTIEAYREFTLLTKLSELDRDFWDLDEDLRALRLKYIRNHPELFVGN